MVLVLVDQITIRIQYTFDFIFKDRGMPYELTTSFSDFEARTEVRKLNYSSTAIEKARRIKPSLLLREASIIPVHVDKVKFEGKIDCLAFDGQCDIVASIFYVLTRFEEYNSEKDEHGRFPFESSVLKKHDWIEKAICDRWSKVIIEFIDPDLYIDVTLANTLSNKRPKFVPTFDIDNTYAYKYKSGKRKLLSICRDFLTFDFKRVKERSVTNAGGKDPYDTYDRIDKIAQEFPETKLFWLVESNGIKDRNLELSIPQHIELIQKLAQHSSVNLHPSYEAYTNADEIKKQKLKLEKVLDAEVSATRQHFLRFKLPQTFQALQAANVTEEYSMGFPERAGFRSGTARSHRWFDLSKNEVTDLIIHPFVYMDGTLNEYMKLTIDESKVLVKKLYDEVKDFGGDFIFLWHNETIGDYKKWKGWSEVLDFTIKLNK